VRSGGRERGRVDGGRTCWTCSSKQFSKADSSAVSCFGEVESRLPAAARQNLISDGGVTQSPTKLRVMAW